MSGLNLDIILLKAKSKLMKTLSDFDKLTLTLSENRISSILDNTSNTILKTFHKRLIKKGIPKIYVIKDKDLFLYVGITIQSLSSRFRYGLKADGEKGYHGYKWKTKDSIELYVWCFESIDKDQIENIEAELAFLIRTRTGKWPLNQNEIHFNNNFDSGKEIAKKMLSYIE